MYLLLESLLVHCTLEQKWGPQVSEQAAWLLRLHALIKRERFDKNEGLSVVSGLFILLEFPFSLRF